jgi:hypothetical protein
MAPPLTTRSGYYNSALKCLRQGYANCSWSLLMRMILSKFWTCARPPDKLPLNKPKGERQTPKALSDG